MNDELVEGFLCSHFSRLTCGELDKGALLPLHYGDGPDLSELVEMVSEINQKKTELWLLVQIKSNTSSPGQRPLYYRKVKTPLCIRLVLYLSSESVMVSARPPMYSVVMDLSSGGSNLGIVEARFNSLLATGSLMP